jgi:hypothetical protein
MQSQLDANYRDVRETAFPWAAQTVAVGVVG